MTRERVLILFRLVYIIEPWAMKYSYPDLNACAAAMSGFQDSQRNRNGALGVIRRIGIDLSGSKVGQEGV